MPINKLRYSTYKDFEREASNTVNEIIDKVNGLPSAGEVARVVDKMSLARQFSSIIAAGDAKAHLYGNSLTAAIPSAPMVAASVSAGTLQIVDYAGVGGYTSAQILAKMQTDGFDVASEIVFYQEGTNDASQGVTLVDHLSNMQDIANYIISNNKVPAMILTSPSDDAEYAAELYDFWFYERILAERMGIAYFDPYQILTDTDGGYISAYTLDGVHPTKEGYTLSGFELWGEIEKGAFNVMLPRDNIGKGIFGSNVLFLTDSNADGRSDGWQISSLTSPTFTLTASDAPSRGNQQNIAFSQTSAGQLYRVAASGFAVGDRMRVTGVAGLSGSSNALMEVFVRCNTAGVDEYACAFGADADMSIFSREFVVPAGTTDLRVFVRLSPAAGGTGTGTAHISAVDIINLTNANNVIDSI